MNERVKEYIDSKCESDKVAEAGDYESKLTTYVNDKARELLDGKSGYIEDETVFNWIFDFFHDEEYKKATEEKSKVEIPKVNVDLPKDEPKPAKKEKKQSNDAYDGLSLFDL